MLTREQQIEEFLAQTRVAVISTVDAEGRPRTSPIWFEWRDGAAYLFTARTTLKGRNLLRNPHASLCIDRREPPYAAAVIDGTVEQVDEDLYETVLGMAVRYYGEVRGRRFAETYRDPERASRTLVFRLVPRHIAFFDNAPEE